MDVNIRMIPVFCDHNGYIDISSIAVTWNKISKHIERNGVTKGDYECFILNIIRKRIPVGRRR